MPTNLPTDNVVADMERIFKPLGGRALVSAFHHDRDARQRRRRVGGSRRWATLAAAALAILVTVALVIGDGRSDMASGRSAGLPIAASLQRGSARPSVTSSFLPASSASTPDVPDAVVRIAATDPRSSPDNAAPIRAQRSADLTAAPALVPRPLAVAKASMPKRIAPLVTAGAVALTASLRNEQAKPPATNPSCEPGSLEDHCIYQDVMNADARLRVAFNRAKQEGVTKSSLSAALRLWRRARENAEDDPDTTITRYDQLADALDRQHRGAVK